MDDRRRIACGPRLPDACRHHPLVPSIRLAAGAAGAGTRAAAQRFAQGRRRTAGTGGLPLLPASELRGAAPGRRRAAPDNVGAPHHGLHLDRGPAPLGGDLEISSLALPALFGWEHRSAARPRRMWMPRDGTPVLLRDDPNLVPSRRCRAETTTTSRPPSSPPWQWRGLASIRNDGRGQFFAVDASRRDTALGDVPGERRDSAPSAGGDQPQRVRGRGDGGVRGVDAPGDRVRQSWRTQSSAGRARARPGCGRPSRTFNAGAGGGATFELEQIRERGERASLLHVLQARGTSSGVEALGPSTGAIYTIRDRRVSRIEWHYDVDEAFARFEQGE